MITYWHRRANISIGTVQTLPPGASATASVTEDNVLSLGIPQGDDGPQGEKGDPLVYSEMGIADQQAFVSAVIEDLPVATPASKGVVKVGTGLSVDETGTISWNGGSDTPQMSGATASTDGTGGTVPAPLAGNQGKFLRGDATWAAAPYPSEATTSAAGLMSASDKSKLDNVASQATKGGKTLLWSNYSPTSSAQGGGFTISGDIANYDLIVVEYKCRIGYTQYRQITFVPGNYGSPSSGMTTRLASCMQYAGFESNKNGSRDLSAVYTSSSNQTGFSYGAGYFDGSRNGDVCLPVAVWGIKL